MELRRDIDAPDERSALLGQPGRQGQFVLMQQAPGQLQGHGHVGDHQGVFEIEPLHRAGIDRQERFREGVPAHQMGASQLGQAVDEFTRTAFAVVVDLATGPLDEPVMEEPLQPPQDPLPAAARQRRQLRRPQKPVHGQSAQQPGVAWGELDGRGGNDPPEAGKPEHRV